MMEIKDIVYLEIITFWILSEIEAYMLRKNVQYLRTTLKVSYEVTIFHDVYVPNSWAIFRGGILFLCCLFFFDIRILMTPLVSLNSP